MSATEKEQEMIETGTPASVLYYTDVRPCKVIKGGEKKITVQMMKAEKDPAFKPEWVVGGFAAHMVNNGQQTWILEDDPNGKTMEFSLRKNGKWVQVGSDASSGLRLSIGTARKFRDYNF